jgi:hypothetical protein
MAESDDFVAQLAALHEQNARQNVVALDDLISQATGQEADMALRLWFLSYKKMLW